MRVLVNVAHRRQFIANALTETAVTLRSSANKYPAARHVAQSHAFYAGTRGFLLSLITNPQVPA